MLHRMISLLKDIKRFMMDIHAFFLFKIFFKRNIKSKNIVNLIDGVTVVVTSCGRPEHLKEMLLSFTKHNTYEIFEIIIVEDAGCYESLRIAESIVPSNKLKIIFHEQNKGQMVSIDEAYSLVKTKHIFHIEEDWLFINSGFIEKSFEIMNYDKSIGYVCLRPYSDYSMYTLVNGKENKFKLFKTRNLIWKGIFLNPGIYYTQKYLDIGIYKKYKKERQLIQAYNHIGLKGAITNNEYGYVVHNGEGFSTRKNFKVG